MNKWLFVLGLICLVGLLACWGKRGFLQRKPMPHELIGEWKSIALSPQMQKHYGIPASMFFSLQKDGSVEFTSFSFIDSSREIVTINGAGSWYLNDANISNNINIAIKWEVRLVFDEVKYEIGVAIKELDNQLVLFYNLEVDYCEGIMFFRDNSGNQGRKDAK